MKLSRFTPANKIVIKAPIWNSRSVGIATYKIGTHNEVHINTKHYPQPLYISGEKARTFPIEPVKSNPKIKLYIIPIDELETLERI